MNRVARHSRPTRHSPHVVRRCCLVTLTTLLLAAPRFVSGQPQAGGQRAMSDPRYSLPTLVIGGSVDKAYATLRVPAELAEPCFFDGSDVTVSCVLGTSRIFASGKRNLPIDALSLPADSLELTVLAEARLVVGFQAFYTVPAGVNVDSVVHLASDVLTRLWGRPTTTSAPWTWWRADRSLSLRTWSAYLCVFPSERTLSFGVTPRDAAAARASLAVDSQQVRQPQVGRATATTMEAWWSPLWNPLLIAGLQPGEDVDVMAAAAGVDPRAGRCLRDNSGFGESNRTLECTWVAPHVDVAGFRAATLKLGVEPDSLQRTARAHSIWLTFGNFTEPKSEVIRDCRVVEAALRAQWGSPTKQSSSPDDCNLEWIRPPFHARLLNLFDDRRDGPDAWAFILTIDVQPQAMSPRWWNRLLTEGSGNSMRR
jgi:hypothetical protein